MADTDNDILHFISEEEDLNRKKSDGRKWKIIVADDDEEVHAVTALALSDFRYKGRELHIMGSYSAAETEKLIIENPDTAVILLDVVMENHDSGLQLVKFIRETAANSMVRIILRTGQPGYAPEMEVIHDYDINDYKEKTELTSSKLVTTLIASIRNFDDLRRIEENRKSLEIIAASSAEMHGLNNEEPFDKFILSSLSEVLNSFSAEGSVSILNGKFNDNSRMEEFCICSGSGEFTGVSTMSSAGNLIPDHILERYRNREARDEILYEDDSCSILFRSLQGVERFIYIKDIPPLGDLKKNILWTFSSHITTVFNNIELMEEQRKKEEEIRKSLDEKLILVKEIHHRVKNNLQIISSLLHMQSAGINDPQLLEVLKESENRVQSMSLVHEKLYQSDLMATIDFREYISSLAERLIRTYSVSSTIDLKIDTDLIMLSINKAIPCGLIVNEILTNSIKYAFPGNRSGQIGIRMKADGGRIFLEISDNGVGLPEDMDITKIKSLGMKLINVLTDQLDGELRIESDGGTSFRLTFPESEEMES